MTYLETIMENEDIQNVLVENEDLITEADGMISDFNKTLKSFVLQNPEEFIGENLNETSKNIRVFSEVATAQYSQEVSALLSQAISGDDENNESSILEDYL